MMVGPLLLFKMLHCRRINDRKTSTGDESAGEGTSHDDSKMKKEYYEQVCRVCLKEGSIPIFGNDGVDDISEDLNLFGGVEIRADDSHPKYICQTCNALLQGAILLRKTAQQSEDLLNNPHIEDSPDDNEDTELDLKEEIPVNYKERKVKKQDVFDCKKCNVSFDTFDELVNHRMSQEHENMRLVCPYCNKSYAALYYKKHLTLHTKEAPYMCDVCGKNFIMQGHFARHRLTHFYKLPFECSLCPYKGRFRESLKMHMRSHTGEKPYQCSECPSRFINKSNLNKHMLTHKEEPDFKCDSCGRRFYTKREVDLHYKVDHAGVKDHVCNTCGKAFGYRKQMMKHQLKVHKREKLRSGRTPLYLKVESMQQQGQNIATES
ncbi:uncharacterized protein LOC142983488 [Anticarsia gemmatalis]|uniref:uncharacterized protein LOC142983488 n=1 Tax=Anticarsia gemmatalis TaxID=129554 RepID=UPI003F75F7D6